MGREETSTSSIGIKILLSDLIPQITEQNFKLISDILYDGFIEDDNDYCNEVYTEIMYYNKLPDTWLECKEYLEKIFKKYGSYNKPRLGNEITYTLVNGCLYDKYLLVPIKEIISTTRWGYDRVGINGVSTSLDFDKSINTDAFKDIEKYSIVFILKQHTD